MEVIVSPKRRAVHLGQDATFDCNAADAAAAATVQYYWQLPSALVGSGRAEYDRNRLTVVETEAADNHTDVTCLVLRSGKLLGSAKGELVVLPALPATPATTAGNTKTTVRDTVVTSDSMTTTATRRTLETTPVRDATSEMPPPASSTVIRSTPAAEVSTSSPVASHGSPQAPTQRSSVTVSGGLGLGAVAPAVVVGLVLLVCLLVTGVFLLRWRRRRRLRSDGDDADAEKCRPGEGAGPPHAYELMGGPGDFKGECEENHNHKRPATNGYVSRDSLKAFSRGVAPDSLGRYARVVARKDRIVSAGGLGLGRGAGRRRPDPPVLTLSMSSLYEETTPTFVVAGNGGVPEGHYENVLPAEAQRGKPVEIVLVGTPPGGCIEDGDQYVTLTRVPSVAT